MKKLTILIGFLLTGYLGVAQTESAAKALLDEVNKTMKSYKNIYIDFEYTLDNKAEKVQQKNLGNATLEGDKYQVNLFGTTQIFDGKKTYTIIPENEEVNISLMDEDNDNSFTPSKFYSFYQKGYKYSMLNSKDNANKNIQQVQLTPIKLDSDTQKIVVGIDSKTRHIAHITETGKNGTQTKLTVKKFLTNQALQPYTFSFNAKKYKSLGYIIND
ncbi:MAG: outer membrane lipoprotein carrier protein LolA [Flavobacteriaceae bacterium]|nr:outer membrane lipoprotein carrier protein LolA [Flavobacteriaceae bacterium]